MAPGKKGIRYGGRTKGIPNRSTIEKALLAERAIAEAKAAGRKIAKEVLEDFMLMFAGLAAECQPIPRGKVPPPNHRPDEASFEKWARLACDTAAKLAPYQSPTFRAIMVASDGSAMSSRALDGDNVLKLASNDPVRAGRVYRMLIDQAPKKAAG